MANYYVATTGNDATGTGTIGSPWATFSKAIAAMNAGDTTYIRGGTYNQIFNLGTKHGTACAPMTFQGYPSETAIFTGLTGNAGWIQYTTDSVASVVNYITFKDLVGDFTTTTTESQDTGSVFDLNAVHDWTLDNVELRNQHGILMLLNHN